MLMNLIILAIYFVASTVLAIMTCRRLPKERNAASNFLYFYLAAGILALSCIAFQISHRHMLFLIFPVAILTFRQFRNIQNTVFYYGKKKFSARWLKTGVLLLYGSFFLIFGIKLCRFNPNARHLIHAASAIQKNISSPAPAIILNFGHDSNRLAYYCQYPVQHFPLPDSLKTLQETLQKQIGWYRFGMSNIIIVLDKCPPEWLAPLKAMRFDGQKTFEILHCEWKGRKKKHQFVVLHWIGSTARTQIENAFFPTKDDAGNLPIVPTTVSWQQIVVPNSPKNFFSEKLALDRWPEKWKVNPHIIGWWYKAPPQVIFEVTEIPGFSSVIRTEGTDCFAFCPEIPISDGDIISFACYADSVYWGAVHQTEWHHGVAETNVIGRFQTIPGKTVHFKFPIRIAHPGAKVIPYFIAPAGKCFWGNFTVSKNGKQAP